MPLKSNKYRYPLHPFWLTLLAWCHSSFKISCICGFNLTVKLFWYDSNHLNYAKLSILRNEFDSYLCKGDSGNMSKLSETELLGLGVASAVTPFLNASACNQKYFN